MSDASIDITGVDFVTVPTQDYDRAAKFYGETLGLPFVKRWGDRPAGEFQAGNLTIAVMQMDAFGQEFAPHGAPLALQVPDVHAAREALEAEGVEFVDGHDRQRRLPPGDLQGPRRQHPGPPPPLRGGRPAGSGD